MINTKTHNSRLRIPSFIFHGNYDIWYGLDASERIKSSIKTKVKQYQDKFDAR